MRRLLLQVLVLVAVLGCDREGSHSTSPPEPSSAASAPTAASSARQLPSEGLRHLELVTGGASSTDRLPLIVAIHGLGDRPGHFQTLFQGLEARARILLPRAPVAYGTGYSWFRYDRDDIDRTAEGVRLAARRLADWIRRVRRSRPTKGEPIVTGFSQGGMLSFALALHHPDVVGEAYPVSGTVSPSLMPRAPPRGRAPPIIALHGTADRVVPYEATHQAAEALKHLGYPVTLRSYDGVGHTVTTAMRHALWTLLGEAARRQSEQR